MPVIHITCINNLLIPVSEIILEQHTSGSVLSMAEGKQGHASPPTKALVQLITHNLIIVIAWRLGLDQLCWHNFENNRHLKELGIMLE